jgi:hypothetical protein
MLIGCSRRSSVCLGTRLSDPGPDGSRLPDAGAETAGDRPLQLLLRKAVDADMAAGRFLEHRVCVLVSEFPSAHELPEEERS